VVNENLLSRKISSTQIFATDDGQGQSGQGLGGAGASFSLADFNPNDLIFVLVPVDYGWPTRGHY
jgi:hypothetical protein